jgi:DNA-binding XRE family transcriptional regulator
MKSQEILKAPKKQTRRQRSLNLEEEAFAAIKEQPLPTRRFLREGERAPVLGLGLDIWASGTGFEVLESADGSLSLLIPNLTDFLQKIFKHLLINIDALSFKEIGYLRSEMGFTQAAMAEKLGVSQKIIKDIEDGQKPIPPYYREILKFLGFSAIIKKLPREEWPNILERVFIAPLSLAVESEEQKPAQIREIIEKDQEIELKLA